MSDDPLFTRTDLIEAVRRYNEDNAIGGEDATIVFGRPGHEPADVVYVNLLTAGPVLASVD